MSLPAESLPAGAAAPPNSRRICGFCGSELTDAAGLDIVEGQRGDFARLCEGSGGHRPALGPFAAGDTVIAAVELADTRRGRRTVYARTGATGTVHSLRTFPWQPDAWRLIVKFGATHLWCDPADLTRAPTTPATADAGPAALDRRARQATPPEARAS